MASPPPASSTPAPPPPPSASSTPAPPPPPPPAPEHLAAPEAVPAEVTTAATAATTTTAAPEYAPASAPAPAPTPVPGLPPPGQLDPGMPMRRFVVSPQVPKQLSAEDEAARRGSHKEVERRRRQAINDGIEALAAMVPGCGPTEALPGRAVVNKGTVLARAVAYIKALKNNEASNIEKWTLEKLLMDQALGDASAHADALSTELNRVHAVAERLGIAHLFDPQADQSALLPEHLAHLRAQQPPTSTTAPPGPAAGTKDTGAAAVPDLAPVQAPDAAQAGQKHHIPSPGHAAEGEGQTQGEGQGDERLSKRPKT